MANKLFIFMEFSPQVAVITSGDSALFMTRGGTTDKRRGGFECRLGASAMTGVKRMIASSIGARDGSSSADSKSTFCPASLSGISRKRAVSRRKSALL
jgi:hypothetical protein